MYIAIQIVAKYTPKTLEEREAMDNKIMAALGCDDTEPDCPMIVFASTVVDTEEKAFTWLG